MRELNGEKDLQLAKDVLCAFEEAHCSNKQACSDIQESLYWTDTGRCYSADFGFVLRGENEDIRILELEEKDGWFPRIASTWKLTAFVVFKEKIYLFYV